MKKRFYLCLFCLFALTGFFNALQAQCSGGSSAGSITPTTSFQTIACVTGGQYYSFSATSGNSYTFSFCQGGGSASYDTQITILSNTGAYAGGYSDDVCGTGSEVVWVAPSTGTFRVLVNQYNCTTGGGCSSLAYRLNPPPGAGATCASAVVIPALPFSQTGRTTCGNGNNYTSSDACGSLYMDGDDFLYRYTSSGNELITITLSNTGTWTGVFVMDGCPNLATTNCISPGAGGTGCSGGGSASNESSSGNPFGTFFLPSAGTYYILISTWPSPQCTPFDISITSTSAAPTSSVGCYTQTSIPYANVAYNNGTVVSFPDDEHSAVLPIGFTFCYMGQQFTNFVISSNGYISFSTNCATQYSPWETTPVPSGSLPETNNSVMLCWQDIDPGVSGTIRYRLMGTVPNRRLVVIFDQIAMFSTACNSMTFSGQLMLYETSNIIEFHIGSKVVCGSWNDGNAVQGLTSPDGSFAITTPGRNNTVWTTSNEGYRFTPTCEVCTVPLDASYISLQGETNGKQNHLTWETYTEKSLEAFVLERSPGGSVFEEVGRTESLGSETSGYKYEMADPSPIQPITYYRLRELGLDGGSSFSEVIAVASQGATFSLDNVASIADGSALQVNLNAYSPVSNLQVEILDATGRLIMRKSSPIPAGQHSFEYDLGNLGAGYYMLRVSDHQTRVVRKFVLY